MLHLAMTSPQLRRTIEYQSERHQQEQVLLPLTLFECVDISVPELSTQLFTIATRFEDS